MHQVPAVPAVSISTGARSRLLRRKVLATLVGATVGVALLSGCNAAAGAPGQAAAAAQGAASSDPKPTADGPSLPPGGPGFVDNSTAAPVVKRDKEKAATAKSRAVPGDFGSAPAKYTDGVLVSVGGMRSGVVSGTDPGTISGAPYVYMDITIHNGSGEVLPVSNVVATLRYGNGKTAAAPLYEGANELDFAGTINAGDSQTRGYAFMVPKGTESATLYVDIDGGHTPAALSGNLPK